MISAAGTYAVCVNRTRTLCTSAPVASERASGVVDSRVADPAAAAVLVAYAT